jgi:N-acetylmuramic acid 6-phosphate (MurNAc-6-P) etherase
MIKTGYSKEESQNLLRQHKGRLREALRTMGIEG